MTNKFARLDLRDVRGNVFVVGDIHGAFTKLERELIKLDFQPQYDYLLSVGDLVDRGPESYRALEWINYPWFHPVLGNHEQMVIDAGGTGWHTSNGGKWFNKLRYQHDKPSQAEFVQAFKKLPVALEVRLPDKKIGLVHACFAVDDWNEIELYIQQHEEEAIWDRYFLNGLKTEKGYGSEPVVANIDAIYHGHTPMKEPFTSGNRHYIDTGAVYDHADYGNFTIVEVYNGRVL